MINKMNIKHLNYQFLYKPLVIGGKAMEYYGLRKAGDDIDLVIHLDDHVYLKEKYPDNIKDIHGDIGICVGDFEVWNQIMTFDYEYLRENSVEDGEFLIISLERLLFLKALTIDTLKGHDDLKMIVELILKKAYKK